MLDALQELMVIYFLATFPLTCFIYFYFSLWFSRFGKMSNWKKKTLGHKPVGFHLQGGQKKSKSKRSDGSDSSAEMQHTVSCSCIALWSMEAAVGGENVASSFSAEWHRSYSFIPRHSKFHASYYHRQEGYAFVHVDFCFFCWLVGLSAGLHKNYWADSHKTRILDRSQSRTDPSIFGKGIDQVYVGGSYLWVAPFWRTSKQKSRLSWFKTLLYLIMYSALLILRWLLGFGGGMCSIAILVLHVLPLFTQNKIQTLKELETATCVNSSQCFRQCWSCFQSYFSF